MKTPISITAIASVSPLGASLSEAWDSYKDPSSFLSPRDFESHKEWVGSLPARLQKPLSALAEEQPMYRDLDDSVTYALLAARLALEMAGWKKGANFGINIGSSRGATGLFEKYHGEYLKEQRCSVLSSPTTTLGNISSWVAHDLQAQGPDISHSITCSTALHALLNGIAWISSGMAQKFIVGGSEAPLTPFTIAQMRALKIYADAPGTGVSDFPCRALDLTKARNCMVLGEGASMACLQAGLTDSSLAVVEGIGYATEPLEHNVSLSSEALCFQRSMRMALGEVDPGTIDAVVLHAPGTVKGDLAEYRAIERVFGPRLPALTTNKWKIGHTFGASGMLSVEMAVLMLLRQEFIGSPFYGNDAPPDAVNRVMVNAVGFGGNAVSILLKRC